MTAHNPDDLDARTFAWSRAVIGAGWKDGAPPPRFGSAQWWALPASDVRWLAGIVVAATSWYDHARPETVRREMAVELDALALGHERADAEDFAALARWVRGLARSPSWAELQRRRGESA